MRSSSRIGGELEAMLSSAIEEDGEDAVDGTHVVRGGL